MSQEDSYGASVLVTISPFSFDPATVTKMEYISNGGRKYTKYTIRARNTSGAIPGEFAVELMKNEFDAVRVARVVSKTGEINATAAMKKTEDDYDRWIFSPVDSIKNPV